MRASTGHAAAVAPHGRPPATTIPASSSDPLASAWRRARALKSRISDALDALNTISMTKEPAGAEPLLPVPLAGSRTLACPLRIGIALDESGSTSISDPDRAGRQATLTICDWLARYSESPQDRVGLVRFADHTDTIPATPAGQARHTIEQALQAGRDVGGGTQLSPAIEAINRLLQRRGRERTVAILITDGQVAESPREIRQLIGTLRSSADAAYLLALDHDHAWTQHTHRLYQGLGLNGQRAISQFTAAHLAQAIATLLTHEAGQITT